MRTLTAIMMAVVLTACGAVSPRAARIAALEGSPTAGEALFARHCRDCHRKGGLMKTVRWYPKRAFLTVVIDGAPDGKMPGFAQLSDQEIADIYAYIERANQ